MLGTTSGTNSELLSQRIDRLTAESHIQANKMELIGLGASDDAVRIMLDKPQVLKVNIAEFVRRNPEPVNSTSSHGILAHLLAVHSPDWVKRRLLEIPEVVREPNLMGITTGKLVLYSCGPDLRLEILMLPELRSRVGESEYRIAMQIINAQEREGMYYIARQYRLLLTKDRDDTLPSSKKDSELIWHFIRVAPKEVLKIFADELPVEMLKLAKVGYVGVQTAMQVATIGVPYCTIAPTRFTVLDAMTRRCIELDLPEVRNALDERLCRANGGYDIEEPSTTGRALDLRKLRALKSVR